MLTTLLIWLIILLTGLSVGILFTDLVEKYIKNSQSNRTSFILIFFSGISIIMFLGSIFSLFQKISYEFLIVIIALSLPKIKKTFLALRNSIFTNFKDPKSWQVLKVSLFAIYFLLILVQVVKEPFVTDTGLYHAQTIQWIETHKAVKGLGNLHGRLAFNSSFHILCAVYSFSFLNLSTFYNCVQSFLLLIVGVHLINEIFKKGEDSFYRFLYAGILLLLIIFYRDWISSPSPDIPATLLIIVIFIIIFQEIETNSKSLVTYLGILLLSCTVVTVKLSSLPIFAIVALFYWNFKNIVYNKKVMGLSFILLLVTFAPWIVRNVILSGYLIYPLPSLDFFSVQWKIPYDLALQEKKWVHSFAKVGSYNWKEVEKLSFFSWFQIWWSKRIVVEKFIFSIICSTPFVIIYGFTRNRSSNEKNLLLYLLLPSFLGVCFWFYMAPYFRFGHGFIIICFLATLYFILIKAKKLIAIFTFSLTFLFIAYSLFKEITEVSLSRNIIFPKQYPGIAYKEAFIENLKIKTPLRDELCWDEPLPCSPYHYEGLKMLGDSIDEGFYISKE